MRKVRQRRKTFVLAALLAAGLGISTHADAAKKVMCLKTNTGQYIELARVSMMVVPDGGSTFEIVVKDGEGATNVSEVSFESHESDIDLSKYQGQTNGDVSPDMTKPVYMITSTGKYYLMANLPVMVAKDGSDKFDIEVGNEKEIDVSAVYFLRGDKPEDTGVVSPELLPVREKLQLQSVVSSQMVISGCGDATKAVVYALDGRQVAEAPVANGVTTVQVSHLPSAVYIVKVGTKSLKFTKK